jgi:hypothetical protein
MQDEVVQVARRQHVVHEGDAADPGTSRRQRRNTIVGFFVTIGVVVLLVTLIAIS